MFLAHGPSAKRIGPGRPWNTSDLIQFLQVVPSPSPPHHPLLPVSSPTQHQPTTTQPSNSFAKPNIKFVRPAQQYMYSTVPLTRQNPFLLTCTLTSSPSSARTPHLSLPPHPSLPPPFPHPLPPPPHSFPPSPPLSPPLSTLPLLTSPHLFSPAWRLQRLSLKHLTFSSLYPYLYMHGLSWEKQTEFILASPSRLQSQGTTCLDVFCLIIDRPNPYSRQQSDLKLHRL